MNSSAPSYLCFAGIDVAKDNLDLHLLPSAKAQRFSNTDAGRAALVEVLKANNARMVVLESTGGYEHKAVIALVTARIPVHVAQPQIVRAFAKSLAIHAKTDNIDAAVCARYAMERCDDLRTVTQIDKTHESLRELVTRRDQLVGMRAMEQNRLQQASDKHVLKSIKRHLKSLDREVERLEKQIDAMIKADPDLNARAEAIDALPGVGPQTARLMVSLLPELGGECDKRLNALVGIAPFNIDSGKRKGERHIMGGRTLVRNALYMSCMTAITHNPKIKTHYEKKCGEGRKHHEAMIPCMRKQLSAMNRAIRQLIQGTGEPAAKSPSEPTTAEATKQPSGRGARGLGAGGEAPKDAVATTA